MQIIPHEGKITFDHVFVVDLDGALLLVLCVMVDIVDPKGAKMFKCPTPPLYRGQKENRLDHIGMVSLGMAIEDPRVSTTIWANPSADGHIIIPWRTLEEMNIDMREIPTELIELAPWRSPEEAGGDAQRPQLKKLSNGRDRLTGRRFVANSTTR